MSGRHAQDRLTSTKPDLEPITTEVKFTVEDSQELAVIVDPDKRGQTEADALLKAHKLSGTDAYWAYRDGFLAGWKACEDLYEGRHR